MGGTVVREKLTRSSLISVINYIVLTMQFFLLTMRCFDFQGFLESMKGNVEKCGRNFSFNVTMFSFFLVFRIMYEMQINCGCYDYPLINYLGLIATFLPIIFNALFMISYGLFCMYFNCEKEKRGYSV